MKISSVKFNEISMDEFLSEYWNKKPCLLKGALSEFSSPISGQELAGLAMEEEAHSRIIIKDDQDYELHHGPFKNEDYAKFSDSTYCLLVQEVESFVPEVSELKSQFRFLPDWRMDDIMVSYANDGGTVGAHVDYFDVFLIQGHGQRKWEIGEKIEGEAEYRPDLPIRILKDFKPTETYVLSPGDILYLPPNVPHNGIAIGDSITLSVGFRSPSVAEMVKGYSSHIYSTVAESIRLEEPKEGYGSNPAEIPMSVIKQVKKQLEELPNDEESIAHWFGRLVSEPVRSDSTSEVSEHLAYSDLDVLLGKLNSSIEKVRDLHWNNSVRLAYFNSGKSLKIFIDGEALELDLEALSGFEKLAMTRKFSIEDLEKEKSMGLKYLISVLFDLNILYVDD